VDRDLTENAALDFGIDKGFSAFGGRAGHGIVCNSDSGSARKDRTPARNAETNLTRNLHHA
jgi:hypothetical protein